MYTQCFTVDITVFDGTPCVTTGDTAGGAAAVVDVVVVETRWEAQASYHAQDLRSRYVFFKTCVDLRSRCGFGRAGSKR